MRRLFVLILSILLAVPGLSGCQKGDNPTGDTEGKISVVATIFPQYDYVREIAGDSVQLKMLLPPGSESHSFEPVPQEIMKIRECDLFIYVGGESDRWVDVILESMDTSGMVIISLMDLVTTLDEEIVDGMDIESGDVGGKAEEDPHVWTSPQNAKKIVQAISDQLCSLDSQNAELYQENTKAYLQELDALDMLFQEAVSTAARDILVFGDRFPFLYLTKTYGLTYSAAFPGCSSETEASLFTTQILIDKVRAEQIPVVFYIEFSNGKTADIISEATGAKKLLLHSCHNVTKSDFQNGVTYLQLMTQNAANIKEALS